ncbi:YbaN family protein [bacterium]|nr:YbaN family protein [bacterium]
MPYGEKRGLGPVGRWLLVAAGSVSLGLGVLGIFLPVLPTTPFLLLAAFCYARSSQRLYDWLLNTRHLGPYIRTWREKKAIPLRFKVFVLVLMTVFIVISAVFFVEALWLRILLGVILVAVSIHILRIPTLR